MASAPSPYSTHDKSMGHVSRDSSAYGSSKTVASLKKLSAEAISVSSLSVGKIITGSPIVTLLHNTVKSVLGITLDGSTPVYLVKSSTNDGTLDLSTSPSSYAFAYPFEIDSIAVVALNSNQDIVLTAQIQMYDAESSTWSDVEGTFIPNATPSSVSYTTGVKQSYGIFLPAAPIQGLKTIRLKFIGDSAAFAVNQGFDLTIMANVA